MREPKAYKTWADKANNRELPIYTALQSHIISEKSLTFGTRNAKLILKLSLSEHHAYEALF